MPDKQKELNQNNPPEALPNIFTRKDNEIAIYTILCILRRMKKELGIEAMHEYLENYVQTINKHNPKLQFAVSKALSMMRVEKMYEDACGGKKI